MLSLHSSFLHNWQVFYYANKDKETILCLKIQYSADAIMTLNLHSLGIQFVVLFLAKFFVCFKFLKVACLFVHTF